ncbi:MAG: hypothetical protein QM783_15115 [Phycisphaerales bacterium]
MLSMGADLQRYFGASSSSWSSSSLRMDDMLDGTQRADSFARALSQAIDIKAALSSHATKPSANDAKPSDPAAATAIDAADAKALSDIYGVAVADSPFDRLERARAFFTSYVLALLRLYGSDSRVINVELLNPVGAVGAQKLAGDLGKGTTPYQTATNAIVAAETFELVCLNTDVLPADDPRTKEGKQFGRVVQEARRQVAVANAAVTAALTAVTEGQAGVEKAKKELADAQKTQDDKKKLADEAAAKAKSEADKLVPLEKQAAADKKLLEEAQRTGVGLAAAQAAYNASEKARSDQETKKNEAKAAQTTAEETLAEAQKTTATKQKALATAQEPAKAYAEALAQRGEAERRQRLAELALHDFAWRDARLASVEAVVSNTSTPAPDRLILLMIQAHVNPGNKPDMIAGIKTELTATDSAGRQLAAEDVRVLYVHPGRTYDVADERRFDKVQQSLSVAMAAQIGSAVDANAASDSRSREEEARTLPGEDQQDVERCRRNRRKRRRKSVRLVLFPQQRAGRTSAPWRLQGPRLPGGRRSRLRRMAQRATIGEEDVTQGVDHCRGASRRHF